MPFALVTFGVVIFAVALNGTYKQFGSQLYKDLFQASPPFVYWVLALVAVGAIGYIPKAKKPADAFMVLIILGMIIKNGGVFQQIQQTFASYGSGTTSSTTGTTPSTTANNTNTNTLLNAAGSIAIPQSLIGAAPTTTYTAPSGNILKSLGPA